MARIKLRMVGLGDVAVPVPGTPVPLSPVQLLASGISLQYNPTNTGRIFVKDLSGVTCMVLSAATPAANFEADDSEADEDDVVWDLNEIYLDAEVAGETAIVAYYILEEINYNK